MININKQASAITVRLNMLSLDLKHYNYGPSLTVKYPQRVNGPKLGMLEGYNVKKYYVYD